jgi:hypothetical protein
MYWAEHKQVDPVELKQYTKVCKLACKLYRNMSGEKKTSLVGIIHTLGLVIGDWLSKDDIKQ